MNVPITKITFTGKEFENIKKALESGWIVQGMFVKEFEEKWSQFTGARHSIAVTSCTAALHLSLYALGIGPGDEVILPSFTWIATANAVETLGARPVFCDIDLDTFNMNAKQIEQLITRKTKAVIPVHLFGLAADMDEIMKMAQQHDLFVVEDAACGFAARYKGKHVGNFGHTGCFSFHPRKAITTGEGGMVTCNDGALAAKLCSMRDHGANVPDLQRHLGKKPYLFPGFPYAGFNYRMTDIQASLGCSQMDRAADIYRQRREWAHRYDTFIDTIPWLEKPFRHADYVHGFQSYVCWFQREEINLGNVYDVHRKRNEFMEYLQEKGISTRPGTHAVHMQTFYREKYNLKPGDYPHTMMADLCSIALPLFPAMTEDEFSFISNTIKRFKL